MVLPGQRITAWLSRTPGPDWEVWVSGKSTAQIIDGGGQIFRIKAEGHGKNWTTTRCESTTRCGTSSWRLMSRAARSNQVFLGVDGVQLAEVPMIVRLYTPNQHVDLLPKIIEVRRRIHWVSHVVSDGATLTSTPKPGRCRHSLQQVAAGQEPILPGLSNT
jgi:hypothetical protein